MMVDIWQLDKVSDNNQQTWPEGTMEGNQINNAGRDDESLMARWFADWNGSLATSGTGAAYTVTSNTNPTSYYNGLLITASIHENSQANATLNVSGLGAITIRKAGQTVLADDDLQTGMVATFVYRNSTFHVESDTNQGNYPVEDNVDTDADQALFFDNSASANRKGKLENFLSRVWVHFNDAGTLNGSSGVTSVTKNGTGDFTVNFDRNWSSANLYAVTGMAQRSGGFALVIIHPTVNPTASSCRVQILDETGTPVSITRCHLTMLGRYGP